MLVRPPSLKDLSRLYFELAQAGADCTGKKSRWPYHPKNLEELLALAADMSRYDPRLLSILISFIYQHWNQVAPQRLREFYSQMKTAQTMAVIAEFIKTASKNSELNYLMEYLQRGLQSVPFQWYFRDLYSPGGKLGQRAAEESLAQYKRWGFLAREAPSLDVYQKKTIGHLNRSARLEILRRLLVQRKTISLKDYLTRIGNCVSRQQALQDLKAVAKLVPKTSGRGAKWNLKK